MSEEAEWRLVRLGGASGWISYGGSLRVDVSIFEIDLTFEIVKYPNIKYHFNPPFQLTVYAILLLIEIVKYIK